MSAPTLFDWPAGRRWQRRLLIAGLQRGTAGYRRVFALRRPAPWAWLPGGHHDLVGARDDAHVSSILRNVNPHIEIFQRERP